MFEKLYYWYFKKELQYFSKEDQKLFFLQHKHWHFVAAACFIAIIIIFFVLEEIFAIISQNIIASLIGSVIGGLAATFIFLKYGYRMTKFLYPKVITKRGKAILKEDFKEIKERCPILYDEIMSDECCGLCYFFSFAIMHVLKKGYMQFIAVKQFYEIGEERKETYKIHVVYANNGWCFDTYSQRQMPITELREIWQGKWITNYNYNDIKGKTFEEFRDSQATKLRRWCKENDCSYFIMNKPTS